MGRKCKTDHSLNLKEILCTYPSFCRLVMLCRGNPLVMPLEIESEAPEVSEIMSFICYKSSFRFLYYLGKW